MLEEGDFRAYSGLSARQPPDHTRLRGFINKAFTPRRIATLEPSVRELAVGMIESFQGRGRADLVADLARDLPAFVIFRLLGIPDEDVPNVKEWAASRVYLNFGDLPIEQQVHHARNLVKYWSYCLELIEKRFEEQRDDLPSDLVRIYQSGDQSISIDEMAGLVYGQLTAGHETTSSLLGRGPQELLTQRDALGGPLRGPFAHRPPRSRSCCASATPVFAWKRLVKQPAHDRAAWSCSRGDNVLLMLGSGNHDETVFDDPEAIDLHGAQRPQPPRLRPRHPLLPRRAARAAGGPGRARGADRAPARTCASPRARSSPTPPNTTFRAPHRVLADWELRTVIVARRRCMRRRTSPAVGGKAASLGEMIQAGPCRCRAGFADLATDGGVSTAERSRDLPRARTIRCRVAASCPRATRAERGPGGRALQRHRRGLSARPASPACRTPTSGSSARTR